MRACGIYAQHIKSNTIVPSLGCPHRWIIPAYNASCRANILWAELLVVFFVCALIFHVPMDISLMCVCLCINEKLVGAQHHHYICRTKNIICNMHISAYGSRRAQEANPRARGDIDATKRRMRAHDILGLQYTQIKRSHASSRAAPHLDK